MLTAEPIREDDKSNLIAKPNVERIQRRQTDQAKRQTPHGRCWQAFLPILRFFTA
jgi:hypothetical protein